MERERGEGLSSVKGPLEGGLLGGGLQFQGRGGYCSFRGGVAAAILSLPNGGGERLVCSAAAWVPSPQLPKEPEQCWQSCLHVFIIIKNMTYPSSGSTSITRSHFPSPLPLQSFCILFPNTLSPSQVCLTGEGTLPFPSPSLVAP